MPYPPPPLPPVLRLSHRIASRHCAVPRPSAIWHQSASQSARQARSQTYRLAGSQPVVSRLFTHAGRKGEGEGEGGKAHVAELVTHAMQRKVCNNVMQPVSV